MYREFIFNASDIVTQIYNKFVNIRSTDTFECQLCFNTTSNLQKFKICMRDICNSYVCNGCMYQWLANVSAGSLVEYSQCSCPFCRQPFDKKIAKFHPIGSLIIPPDAFDQSVNHYMAWCCGCNKLKIHSDRICASEPPANVLNFVCDTCRTPRIEISYTNIDHIENNERVLKNVDRIVNCSKCNSPVCKAIIINGVTNYGCNHIKCIVCDSEVCAFENCGQAFPNENECYNHMTNEHGNFYDIDEEDY